MLDDGAVGDVLVGWLAGLAALGLYCCGVDEGFKDVLLDTMLAAELQRCPGERQ